MSQLNVLCISPRFAPSNEADTHRLRLLLGHAESAGWRPVVVAVEADCLEVAQDAWLLSSLPNNIEVFRVRVPNKRFGLASVFVRAWQGVDRQVRALLAARSFDLVFFSTNEFPLAYLAIGWKRDFGVRFSIDYQDPWVNDYYRQHPWRKPPGGRLKFAVMDRINRVLERGVVRHCSGFLTVSQAYLDTLVRRYGDMVGGKPMLVRPFPAEPGELMSLRAETVTAVAGKNAVWRYIGRGGGDMAKAASAFFQAWHSALKAGYLSLEAARMELIGTSYATSGSARKTFEPLVADTPLASQVSENPERLGYSEALSRLLSSDALVVFGSDDPAYTASKIYPYLLARKPLLAIFHENSSVVKLLSEVGGSVCVSFNEETSPEALAAAIEKAWFSPGMFRKTIPMNNAAFEPYTAKVQARELGEWFNTILALAE